MLGSERLNGGRGHLWRDCGSDGFGGAVGFSLVMVLFAAMRERIAVADVPVAFQGSAIAMITAGLMSLAFLGFTGLVSI